MSEELARESYSKAEARFSAALLDLWREADRRGGPDSDELVRMVKRALDAEALPWVSIRAGERPANAR